jgi:hypothetical protein
VRSCFYCSHRQRQCVLRLDFYTMRVDVSAGMDVSAGVGMVSVKVIVH